MSAGTRRNAAAVEHAGMLSPGEHLRAEIGRLALDQVAVSKAAGVSRQSINNIINGRQPISRAMAIKLGRLTGHTPDYWLRGSFPREGDCPTDGDTAPPFGFGTLVNHEIVRAIRDGTIGIEAFAARNVQAAALDLTLADIVVTADGEKIDISRHKGFVLKAGCAVNVSTKERISIPPDHMGRAAAVNRLGTMGIITSQGFQIEPGFKGRLSFCLFNAGGANFRLRAGEPVISLEIVRLNAHR